jgi:hypothetical protein
VISAGYWRIKRVYSVVQVAKSPSNCSILQIIGQVPYCPKMILNVFYRDAPHGAIDPRH